MRRSYINKIIIAFFKHGKVHKSWLVFRDVTPPSAPRVDARWRRTATRPRPPHGKQTRHSPRNKVRSRWGSSNCRHVSHELRGFDGRSELLARRHPSGGGGGARCVAADWASLSVINVGGRRRRAPRARFPCGARGTIRRVYAFDAPRTLYLPSFCMADNDLSWQAECRYPRAAHGHVE